MKGKSKISRRMTQLDYFFTGDDGLIESYQLIRFSSQEPWRIVLKGEYLASIEKVGDNWHQLSGKDLETTFFIGISSFIDSQYFNSLPKEILSRWPKLIQEVVVKSDEEYLIICKAGINFEGFVQIFTRFIPGLLKDEWPVRFQVFNHDFSADFNLVIEPEKKMPIPAYRQWKH